MKKLNKEIILETLHENRKIIRSFGVKKLILFGSYVKNEQKENSDIDFLVEFKYGRGLFRDYFQLKHYLENIFNKNIDLLEPKYIRKELKDEILGGELNEAKV